LREEHRLRVFENRVLRKIFGPKRQEDGSWRKLHNDELHSLYSSPNIVRVIKSRRMRWTGHVARMGEGRGVYTVLVGRPEGKRPLGRPRCRQEDNVKIDLREIGIDGANWIQLAQDSVQWRACVSPVMKLRVPQESRIFFDKLSDNQLFK
jgi:transposase